MTWPQRKWPSTSLIAVTNCLQDTTSTHVWKTQYIYALKKTQVVAECRVNGQCHPIVKCCYGNEGASRSWSKGKNGSWWWLQRLCMVIMDHNNVWMKDGTLNEQLCSLIQLKNNISLKWVELSQTTVKEAKIELVLADKDSWQHSW